MTVGEVPLTRPGCRCLCAAASSSDRSDRKGTLTAKSAIRLELEPE